MFQTGSDDGWSDPDAGAEEEGGGPPQGSAGGGGGEGLGLVVEGDDLGFTVPDLAIHHIHDDLLFRTPDTRKKVKVVGRYIMGERLGEGAYSKVKGAIDCQTLRRYAVKIMKNKKLRKIPNGQENVRREIRLLRTLQHENVIHMADVLYHHHKQKIYIVMEYCVTNLQDMLGATAAKRFPMWQAQGYFRQLMTGLEYLHSRSVVHRDIKPGNLLLTVGDVLKISDFGVADQISMYAAQDLVSSSSGSPAFQSPEVANGLEAFSGFKVDVWAAGVTLWNLTLGTYPFDGETVFVLFANIGRGDYELPEGVPPLLAALIKGVLDIDARKRLSAAKALRHPWAARRLPRDCAPVPVPPLETDTTNEHHGTSVLPYLEDAYPEDTSGGGAAESSAAPPPEPPQVISRGSFSRLLAMIDPRRD